MKFSSVAPVGRSADRSAGLRPPSVFGHDRFHLSNGTSALASPGDGTILAGGSGSETIVWDVATGNAVARTNEASFSLAFEDAGTLWMALARVHRWRFLSGEPEQVAEEIHHPIAISKARRILAGAHEPTEDGHIGLLSMNTTSVTRLDGRGARINSLSFSTDGDLLAIGDEKGAWIAAMDGGMRYEVPSPTKGRSGLVAFVPGTITLAVARTVSKEVLFVNAHDRKVMRSVSVPDFVEWIAPAPDGRQLAIAYDDGLTVVDVKTGHAIVETKEKTDRKHAVFVAADRVAANAYRSVRFFDMARKRWDDVAPTHIDRVSALGIARDGSILVTSGRFDKTVRIWRVADGAQLHEKTDLGSGIASLSVAPDARTVAVGTITGEVGIVEMDTGRSTLVEDHENYNVGVAHAPDGALFSAGGGRIVARNASTGSEEGKFAAFASGSTTDDVRLGVSGDGRFLLLLVEDRLTVYEIATATPIFDRDDVRAAAIAPDTSSLVAWADDEEIQVAELPSGRRVAHWDRKLVGDMAMLGDGRIAVAFFRGKVELFEIGVPTPTVIAHDGPAATVACSGVLVAIGYEDGTATTVMAPPSVAGARERLHEDELAPIRALVRSIAVRTQAALYRDAPLDAGIDPDECGFYTEREGVGIRVRGTVENGHFVLVAAKATRDESIEMPHEGGFLERIKAWFRGDDERLVIRRGTIAELPSPEDFDAWLTLSLTKFQGPT